MNPLRQYGVVTHAAALSVIERALAEGAAMGVPVSVAVVDPWMNLVAFTKSDGATPHSVESSRRKANTAASTRRATGWMNEDLALALPLATDLKLTNIAGGSPLAAEGAVAGAVGVAGGTPEQDARIAAAAAASFGDAAAGVRDAGTLDAFVRRNRGFATHEAAAGELMPSLPAALPSVKALIIGCADMRVDPAHVLGLRPGEAVVMRNIGGRVVPGTLEMLGLLGKIGEIAGAAPGGGGEFHVIVLQHTDCGITRLTRERPLLAQYFEVEADAIDEHALTDPRAAVTADVAALAATGALPAPWLLSGLVYDVATGLVDVVVPPHAAADASAQTNGRVRAPAAS